MRTVVIKLGGSLITDKSRPFTLKKEALESVAEAFVEASAKGRIVIVHGGGSFGHYAVSQASGTLKRLVADVAYWMSALNMEVVSALMSKGVAAVGLPTWLVARRSRGKLDVESGLVRDLLDIGVVPVTHGGLIGGDGGFEILSGDTLACELAIEMAADALIFLMDVEGVYTEDPRVSASASLVKVLRRSDVQTIKGGSAGIDVTGGLTLKLREAVRAAESGVRVALGSVRALREMIEGSDGLYTRVIP